MIISKKAITLLAIVAFCIVAWFFVFTFIDLGLGWLSNPFSGMGRVLYLLAVAISSLVLIWVLEPEEEATYCEPTINVFPDIGGIFVTKNGKGEITGRWRRKNLRYAIRTGAKGRRRGKASLKYLQENYTIEMKE